MLCNQNRSYKIDSGPPHWPNNEKNGIGRKYKYQNRRRKGEISETSLWSDEMNDFQVQATPDWLTDWQQTSRCRFVDEMETGEETNYFYDKFLYFYDKFSSINFNYRKSRF